MALLSVSYSEAEEINEAGQTAEPAQKRRAFDSKTVVRPASALSRPQLCGITNSVSTLPVLFDLPANS